MANYKPLACHYARFGEKMPPVSNVTQDTGCKRTERKKEKKVKISISLSSKLVYIREISTKSVS